MKKIIFLCAVFFPSAISNAAASEIDPYLEKSTIAVAQLDLSRFDLPGTTKLMQNELPEIIPPQAFTGVQLVGNGILQSLRDIGVTRVYATFSTIEVTSGQLAVIVPTSKTAKVSEQLDTILAMLPAAWGYKTHAGKGAVIVTTESVWKRLATEPKAARPELVTALDQTISESVTVTLNVREDLSKAIANAWPEHLPKESPIELSPKAIMQDVHTLQLAMQTPPELKMKVTAVCRNSSASERIAALTNQLFEKFNLNPLKCIASESEASVSASGGALTAIVRRAASRAAINAANLQQSNHLKQVILAVHNFHSAHEAFPPRMTVSEQGKPLLSWRVFLLPYLGQQALYKAFHLDEPWDSPHNLLLLERIPVPYQSQQFPELKRGQTLVQMPLYPDSTWAGRENRMLSFKDVTQNASETICFVIAPREKAVPWTKPDDLTLGSISLIPDLFGSQESSLFAFIDGSVQTLAKTINETELKKMLTHTSSEVRKR